MATRKELLAAIGSRYRAASKVGKERILDEFVATTGYHRKHAIRAFRANAPAARAYEAASEIERGALCRRERIYSSLLSNWRKQRRFGRALSARRGRKPDPEATEVTRLQKRNAALE